MTTKVLVSVLFAITGAAVLACIPGCHFLAKRSAELERSKAMRLSTFELRPGVVATYRGSLPQGNALLVLFVHNYRCRQVPEVNISIDVNADRQVVHEIAALQRLTWSYGADSCGAYGYVRGKDGGAGTQVQVKQNIAYEIEVAVLAS